MLVITERMLRSIIIAIVRHPSKQNGRSEKVRKGGRVGGRKRREGEREGGREGGRQARTEGGRQGGRQGGIPQGLRVGNVSIDRESSSS